MSTPVKLPELGESVTEVLPVRRLVLVGVGVPVGTVGHQRLGLVDRTPFGADSRHVRRVVPRPPTFACYAPAHHARWLRCRQSTGRRPASLRRLAIARVGRRSQTANVGGRGTSPCAWQGR